MLRNISVKNFRTLEKVNNLELRPITIFCGSNSCGKSSLLKSILLYKQTIENSNMNRGIILNGDYVRLGDYENVVFRHDSERDIEMSYVFDFSNTELTDGVVNIAIRRLSRVIKNIGRLREHKIELAIRIGIEEKSISISKAIVKEYSVKIVDKKNNNICNINLSLDGSKYNIKYSNLKSLNMPSFVTDVDIDENGRFQNFEVIFHGILPDSTSIFQNVKGKNIDDRENFEKARAICEFLQATNVIFQKHAGGFRYVGPLREEPARRYIYENVVTDIGVKGENAPYLFLNEANSNIKEHFFINDSGNSFESIESITLEAGLGKWLKSMGIDKFHANPESEIIRITLEDCNKTNTVVNIADVGFGISQIFPILLEGLRMPCGSTLILEQPEIHLNPSLQMKMADYFVSLAKSNKNLLIETHSDHLINRLVRRIIEDTTGYLSQAIQIYFFVQEDTAGGFIEPVQIDDERGIVNWPKGFFDQGASEQELIIRAGLAKRKAKREQNTED